MPDSGEGFTILLRSSPSIPLVSYIPDRARNAPRTPMHNIASLLSGEEVRMPASSPRVRDAHKKLQPRPTSSSNGLRAKACRQACFCSRFSLKLSLVLSYSICSALPHFFNRDPNARSQSRAPFPPPSSPTLPSRYGVCLGIFSRSAQPSLRLSERRRI